MINFNIVFCFNLMKISDEKKTKTSSVHTYEYYFKRENESVS